MNHRVLRSFQRIGFVVVPSGCFIWAGNTGSGYGVISETIAYKTTRFVRAHRVAYELAHGEIPPSTTIDHLCFERLCVNPRHLEAVPLEENVRRAYRAGRHSRRISEQGSKPTCHRNHDLTGNNVYVRRDGRRDCRECRRLTRKKARS